MAILSGFTHSSPLKGKDSLSGVEYVLMTVFAMLIIVATVHNFGAGLQQTLATLNAYL